MKKLVFGFLILFIAIGFSFLIQKDPGYILITYDKWSLETSLWVGIIAMIIIFTVLYILLRFIKHLSLLGGKFERWGRSRKDKMVHKHTNTGLCDLAEGNWQKAEVRLVKAAKESRSPLINYLAAARAAQAQEAFDRRDDYLRKAHHLTAGSEVAVGLTQAQLQMNSKQWEQALATLKHLNHIAPNHRYVLKLLATVYEELKDWQQLYDLLPALKKFSILAEKHLVSLEMKIYIALLNRAAHEGSETLLKFWQQVPRSWQVNPDLATQYSTELIRLGQHQQAIEVIESTLKKSWDPRLINLYGEAETDNLAKQLSNAEAWLKKQPRNAELLLTLARLSVREKLWGKAQEYLEQSLKIRELPLTYLLLGQVKEATHNKEDALTYYRKGLSLIKGSSLRAW